MSIIELPSSTQTPQPGEGPYTPDDLLRWPGEGVYELIDGHIVEKPMGNESGIVISSIATELVVQLQRRGKGLVASEGWLRCFPEMPKKVLRADVVFAAASHFALGAPVPEMFAFAPELAVEVTSPRNTIDEIEKKVVDYLEAGIPLVWVAHPPLKWIRVHKPGNMIRQYGVGETIDPEPLLPGLVLKVSDVFNR